MRRPGQPKHAKLVYNCEGRGFMTNKNCRKTEAHFVFRFNSEIVQVTILCLSLLFSSGFETIDTSVVPHWCFLNLVSCLMWQPHPCARHVCSHMYIAHCTRHLRFANVFKTPICTHKCSLFRYAREFRCFASYFASGRASIALWKPAKAATVCCCHCGSGLSVSRLFLRTVLSGKMVFTPTKHLETYVRYTGSISKLNLINVNVCWSVCLCCVLCRQRCMFNLSVFCPSRLEVCWRKSLWCSTFWSELIGRSFARVKLDC